MSGPTRLLIATPYDGADLGSAMVTLGHMRFVLALERELRAELVDQIAFSQDVVRARNRCAAAILRDHGDATHVLWLDVDNFAEDAAAGVLTVKQMIALDVPVIAAPYTSKREPARCVHNNLPHEEIDSRGLLKVSHVGFGFVLMTLDVLRTMTAAPTTAHYYDLPRGDRVANLFGQVIDKDGERPFLASEDYSFCWRWRHLHGGSVYLYANATTIMHAGSKSYCVRDVPR